MTLLQGQSQLISDSPRLSVMRPSCTQYIDGKPVQSPDHAFTVSANVQPLNGRDLLLVPEGDRHKEQYWAWVQLPETLRVQDRVFYRDANYQVQQVEAWGSYFKGRMVRIDVGPYARGS